MKPKGRSGKDLLIWAIIMLFIFYPVGLILLLIAALKFRKANDNRMMRVLLILLTILFILIPAIVLTWLTLSWN